MSFPVQQVEPVTVQQAKADAARHIDARDADVLLRHLLHRDRAWMLAHGDEPVSSEHRDTLQNLVARRAAGEPLQYITGVQEFYGLALEVSPAVLIPRPETELLVEQTLLWAASVRSQRLLRVADVGTGSGAIAIALLTHLAAARVLATDVSAAALAVAARNAAAHGCTGRVRFAEADLLGVDVEAGALDAVVSNPPYVPAGDAASLQREVVDHEPHGALFAGADGLAVYRRLVPEAHRTLRRGGLLAMEIGFGQREPLASLLQGWNAVRFVEDYAGIPRVVLAERR